MAKTRICFRIDTAELEIVKKYAKLKGIDQSEAIRQIISAYPLLKAKTQTKALAQQIKKVHCRAVGKEIDKPSELYCLECRVPPERCDIKKKILES